MCFNFSMLEMVLSRFTFISFVPFLFRSFVKILYEVLESLSEFDENTVIIILHTYVLFKKKFVQIKASESAHQEQGVQIAFY